MRALVNAATNSLIALRTLVSAESHRYAERPQLPLRGWRSWRWVGWNKAWRALAEYRLRS